MEVPITLTADEVGRLLYWSLLNDRECERLKALGANIDKTSAEALTAKLEKVASFFDRLPK